MPPMPKNTAPSSELLLNEVMMFLQRLLERATQTSEITDDIQAGVKELLPLTALLARPESQEMELGQRLEQTLANIWERLGAIETSVMQGANWRTETDQRMAQLEAGQAAIRAQLDASLPGLGQAMQRVETVQDQLQSDLAQLLADLFPEEDLAGT